jgi:hypothetical protein
MDPDRQTAASANLEQSPTVTFPCICTATTYTVRFSRAILVVIPRFTARKIAINAAKFAMRERLIGFHPRGTFGSLRSHHPIPALYASPTTGYASRLSAHSTRPRTYLGILGHCRARGADEGVPGYLSILAFPISRECLYKIRQSILHFVSSRLISFHFFLILKASAVLHRTYLIYLSLSH